MTGLPAGLTASAASPNVTLSRTPTEGGPFSVSVTAKDALGCQVSQIYTLTIDSNPPPVAQCKDVTVSANDATCKAPASIDNGSSDPDGDPISFMQTPAGAVPARHEHGDADRDRPARRVQYLYRDGHGGGPDAADPVMASPDHAVEMGHDRARVS